MRFGLGAGAEAMQSGMLTRVLLSGPHLSLLSRAPLSLLLLERGGICAVVNDEISCREVLLRYHSWSTSTECAQRFSIHTCRVFLQALAEQHTVSIRPDTHLRAAFRRRRHPNLRQGFVHAHNATHRLEHLRRLPRAASCQGKSSSHS